MQNSYNSQLATGNPQLKNTKQLTTSNPKLATLPSSADKLQQKAGRTWGPGAAGGAFQVLPEAAAIEREGGKR